MSCEVLRVFTHEFNHLAVAQQEYQLAKQRHRQVLKSLDFRDPQAQQKFADAQEQLQAAREAYLNRMME